MTLNIEKLDRNIQKIRDWAVKNGKDPDQAVGQYLAEQGITPDEMEKAKSKIPPRRMGYIEGALAMVNQGALFGLNDEFQAAVRNPVGAAAMLVPEAIGDVVGGKGSTERARQAYRQEQQAQQAMQQQFREENPLTANLAMAAGGAATAVPTAMATGGASVAAPVARSAGILGQMGQGAKVGAPFGMLGAYGEADPSQMQGLAGTAGTLAAGGAAGATIGAGIPAIAAGAQALREPAQRLSSYVQRVVGGAPAAMPPPSGASSGLATPVQQKALSAIEAGGMTPEGLRAGLQAGRASGAPTAAVDVGPRPLQRAVRGARTLGGGADEIIDKRLAARAEGQVDRVEGKLTEGLGQPVGPGAGAEALAKERKTLSDPLYQQVREWGRIEDEAILRDLWDRAPVYGPLHNEAIRELNKSTARQVQPLYDGNRLVRTPTLEDLHLIKLGADAKKWKNTRGMVEPSDSLSATAMYELTQSVRGPGGLLSKIEGPAGELYKKANDTYSGFSAMLEAIETGQTAHRMTPETLTRELATMSQSEREAFRGSVVDATLNRIRNAADRAEGANVLKEIFGVGRGSKREWLRILFDDPRKFAEFEAFAKAELNAVRADRYIRGGSQTADKQVDDLLGDNIGQRVVDAGQAGPIAAAWNFGRSLVGDRWRAGLTAAQRSELADVMTSTEGGAADEFLLGLERLRRARLEAETRREGVTAGAIFGAGSSNR